RKKCRCRSRAGGARPRACRHRSKRRSAREVTSRLPSLHIIAGMDSFRRRNPQAALTALEAAAASARGGFACLFSSSDEYETALISQRGAQGHYRASRWPTAMFIGCALAVAATVLLLN